MIFLFKEFFAGLINLLHPKLTRGGSILMYHGVGYNEKFSTVTPEHFEEHLKFLKENGYRVLLLSQLIAKIKNKEDVKGDVSLTFDDGYEDFFTNAYPLLMKYEFKATVFIPTGFIGSHITVSQGKDVFRVMNESQIVEVAQSGLVECMPHTVHHKKLTKMSLDEAIKEITNSKNAIESVTHKPARIFAYPSGKYTSEIVEYLRSADILDGAVTVEPGLMRIQDGLYTLKRNSIDSQVGQNQFKMKVSDGVELYAKIKSWIK